MQKKAYLILQNGRTFCGDVFGSVGEVTGELVFTTAMTGYLETLTDPSYYGQIVIQTFPLIGNYGDIPQDYESAKIHMKAYIVRQWCQEPSNFRCEGTLDAFLKAQGVVGLSGIDTRQLTRIVRECGVMNARISESPELTAEERAALESFSVQNAVRSVSRRQAEKRACDKPEFRVALWDFGAKENIARELVKRGCELTIMPADASAEEILALAPDGVMLSNGPGDPAENAGIIDELKKLCAHKLPMFGICLGHQLLALSQGAQTTKLKYGHRGANQPAQEVATGRVYITSQNHGYAVKAETLPDTARMSFRNANDGTCEGVDYLNMPVFSVQFHPEACAGPRDTAFLFDRFISLMKEEKANAAQ